ncbi:hypothetical protein TorRG33x02_162620, partial [Trema orientale]
KERQECKGGPHQSDSNTSFGKLSASNGASKVNRFDDLVAGLDSDDEKARVVTMEAHEKKILGLTLIRVYLWEVR